MNLIKYEGFKVDYNSYLDRINITKNREWIGISHLTLNIWLSLFDVGSDFEKVSLKQDDCNIEILKLSKTTLLSLTGRNFSTFIVVTEKEIDKILKNIDLIREKIKTMVKNPNKKPRILSVKRKNEKNVDNPSCTNPMETGNDSHFDFSQFTIPQPPDISIDHMASGEFNLNNIYGKGLLMATVA